MNRYFTALCFVIFLSSLYKANGQKYVAMAKHSTTVYLNGISDPLKKTFEQNTKLFLDAINTSYCSKKNQPEIPENIAIDKINETLGNLWAVSPFISVRTAVIENVLSSGQNYEIRNLQIVFEEALEGYEQQDAVLVFDKSGKIIDFKIGLGYHSVVTILKNNISVTDLRRRQLIISFVEDFRTAYNLKNIEFLDNVFSDMALIITGKVLQKTRDGELKPIVEYKRQTKGEYLTNLKYLFQNTRMININFDSVSVVQHPANEGIYGVTLTQTWNSEKLAGGKYRDIGYVFLIIDFTNEEKPKIWVRTWQDKRYIEYDHGVFSFNHFNIQ